MQQDTGELVEIYMENGQIGGRMLCRKNLIPAPGQYLLAYDPASNVPLAAPIFSAGSAPGGFLVAPPLSPAWRPGSSLALRGPLGRGFTLPGSARFVALVVLGETVARLKPLMATAIGQDASVVLVSDLELAGLPPEVEVRPSAAFAEIAEWADYLAVDLSREFLPGLRDKLRMGQKGKVWGEMQVLIHTPMPCGGMAECGVCAITTRHSWKLACKDGPVFDIRALI